LLLNLVDLEDVVLKESICWFFRKRRWSRSRAKNLQSEGSRGLRNNPWIGL